MSSRVFNRRIGVTIAAALVAFLAYSSVYAFRKPFTMATHNGAGYFGVSYQSLLIIAQVVGYMLSKFFGIKMISELKSKGRFKAGLLLTGCAWLSLFFLAIVPPPFGLICLFVNGFMLGFMWGIIFSYLEGRRTTDLMGSVMAVSFIFAGGFTRSVAKWLMIEWGVSERWMPFMTGVIFALPLILLLRLLEKIPPPDVADIRDRSARIPMDRSSRKRFLGSFGIGLGIVTITYLFLTIMRDIRDNYMGNIWSELGYGNNIAIFSKTETLTSLVVLLIMAMLVMIRRNMRALSLVHFVIGGGLLLAGISSILFVNDRMDGALWMQLTGLGLYMGYIPFNCIFFERLIATFRVNGNAGFLIYFADAFGYLGSVIVMLSKEIFRLDVNWSGFYAHGVVIGALVGLAGTVFSFLYFKRKYRIAKHS
ncbi:MAG: hypothetical protein H7Y42_05235 [Chitinophagaceae bacterium]|nr:hypothetical protein [Chitinophagaceae bacterium]